MKSIEQFFSEPKNKTETQNHTISAEFLELKFPLPQVNHIRLKKNVKHLSKIFQNSQNFSKFSQKFFISNFILSFFISVFYFFNWNFAYSVEKKLKHLSKTSFYFLLKIFTLFFFLSFWADRILLHISQTSSRKNIAKIPAWIKIKIKIEFFGKFFTILGF